MGCVAVVVFLSCHVVCCSCCVFVCVTCFSSHLRLLDPTSHADFGAATHPGVKGGTHRRRATFEHCYMCVGRVHLGVWSAVLVVCVCVGVGGVILCGCVCVCV